MSSSKTLFCSLLLLAAMLVGCGRSSPTTFYLLHSSHPLTTTQAIPKTTLRIARVSLPAYLDRDSIVSNAQDPFSVHLPAVTHWAEPLSEGVRRVLQSELTDPLRQKGIAVLSQGSEEDPRFTLFVEILRLDGILGKTVRLEASYAFVETKSGALLGKGLFAAEEPTADATYTSYVATESTLLGHLANHISEQLPLKVR